MTRTSTHCLRAAAVGGVLVCMLTAGAVATVRAQTLPATRPPSPQSATSAVPQGDVTAVIKRLGLQESTQPVRELVKGWKKPTKIIVRSEKNPVFLAWLQEAAPGVTLIPVSDAKEAMKYVADADAVVGLCGPRELIEAGNKLRWMQSPSAGVEHCADIPDSIASRLLLTNMQRFYGNIIADHVLAMMLSLTRGLDLLERQNQNEHFVGNMYAAVPPSRLWEIQGRTLLVVGLGGIGTDVAKWSHALGMHVIATRNSGHEGPDFVDYVGVADELPQLIGKADVVVCALPLTNETKHLFNAAMFARMKKGAYFINVGRGEEVVTDDLIAALNSGQVGGAGLDVTDPEPLPDHHPLFRAPNTIITPHLAAGGISAEGTATGPQGEEYWLLFREQLRRYVAGEKIYSIVDMKRGY